MKDFLKKIKILTVLGQLRYFQVLPGTLKPRFLGQLITRLKKKLGHLSSRFGHFRGFFERMLTVPTVNYFRKKINSEILPQKYPLEPSSWKQFFEKLSPQRCF